MVPIERMLKNPQNWVSPVVRRGQRRHYDRDPARDDSGTRSPAVLNQDRQSRIGVATSGTPALARVARPRTTGGLTPSGLRALGVVVVAGDLAAHLRPDPGEHVRVQEVRVLGTGRVDDDAELLGHGGDELGHPDRAGLGTGDALGELRGSVNTGTKGRLRTITCARLPLSGPNADPPVSVLLMGFPPPWCARPSSHVP